MSENSLIPVEQRRVEFYEDLLIAVRLDDGSIYIPVKPICDLLGVDWAGQFRRIQRDEVLNESVERIDVTSTRRGTQPMICLPLDYISGFLFGINPSRVKPELKERVIRYRRECYKVLAEAFKDGRLTTDRTLDELLQADSPAAQAYKMANAIMKMAQQQLLLESQVETHSELLGEHTQRIEQLELSVGVSNRQVSPEQAMQISQAVKAVALELGKRSGRNEYGGVYGELYRRYSINSYKMLLATDFKDALNWLNQWLQSLTETDSPF